MNTQPSIGSKGLWFRAVLAVFAFLAAFAAARYVILLGLWMLVIGDDGDPRWFWLAPILAIVVASGVTMIFWQLSKRKVWSIFALSLLGIVVGFFVGWGFIILLDEGF